MAAPDHVKLSFASIYSMQGEITVSTGFLMIEIVLIEGDTRNETLCMQPKPALLGP